MIVFASDFMVKDGKGSFHGGLLGGCNLDEFGWVFTGLMLRIGGNNFSQHNYVEQTMSFFIK